MAWIVHPEGKEWVAKTNQLRTTLIEYKYLNKEEYHVIKRNLAKTHFLLIHMQKLVKYDNKEKTLVYNYIHELDKAVKEFEIGLQGVFLHNDAQGIGLIYSSFRVMEDMMHHLKSVLVKVKRTDMELLKEEQKYERVFIHPVKHLLEDVDKFEEFLRDDTIIPEAPELERQGNLLVSEFGKEINGIKVFNNMVTEVHRAWKEVIEYFEELRPFFKKIKETVNYMREHKANLASLKASSGVNFERLKSYFLDTFGNFSDLNHLEGTFGHHYQRFHWACNGLDIKLGNLVKALEKLIHEEVVFEEDIEHFDQAMKHALAKHGFFH